MITAIRSRFKGGGMVSLIWIALLSMGIGTVLPLIFKSTSQEPWAIRINGSQVSYKVFAEELASNRAYIAALRSQYGQFAEYILQSMGFSDPQSMTFKMLVMQEIAAQALAKNGLLLHQQYIASKMHNAEFVQNHLADILPAQLINADGSINAKDMRSYLQRRGMSMPVFEQKIAYKIGGWFLSNILEAFSYVPDYIVKYTVLQQKSIKDFSYIELAYDDFVAQETKHKNSSDEEIQSFFERENRIHQRYVVPEKRDGISWAFTPETYGIIVDDRAIESYYEQHKDKTYVASPATVHVRQIVFTITDEKNRLELQKKMQDLRDTLATQPDLFAEYARTKSDDTESAQKSGLIDPFSRGTKDRAFERAAFILQNDGDISPVIDLNDRFIIIQRVNKAPQTYKSLSLVHDDIVKKLQNSAFLEVFSQNIEKIVRAEPNIRADFIKEHRATKAPLKDIERSEKALSRALFDLKEGQFGFYIEGNTGYLVKLETIAPSYTPSLDSVQPAVIKDIIAERAHKAHSIQKESLLQQLRNNPIETVAQEHHLTLHTISSLSPQDKDRMQSLIKKGIDANALIALEKVGAVVLSTHNTIDRLVQCTAIHQAQEEVESAELVAEMDRLQKEERSHIVNGYFASLYRNATIETNDVLAMPEEENSI